MKYGNKVKIAGSKFEIFGNVSQQYRMIIFQIFFKEGINQSLRENRKVQFTAFQFTLTLFLRTNTLSSRHMM